MTFFSKLELRYCFIYSQFIYIFGGVILYLQALRVNLELGIPDIAVYCFSHIFNNIFERILTFFPTYIFVAKISAPGVEGTMSSLGSTIITLNMHFLRDASGLLINHVFIGVTRSSIEDYSSLALITLMGTVVPLLYMKRLIPSNLEIDEL